MLSRLLITSSIKSHNLIIDQKLHKVFKFRTKMKSRIFTSNNGFLVKLNGMLAEYKDSTKMESTIFSPLFFIVVID